jgi:hypothetical protein
MELSDILQKRSFIEDVQSQAVNRRMTENAMAIFFSKTENLIAIVQSRNHIVLLIFQLTG